MTNILPYNKPIEGDFIKKTDTCISQITFDEGISVKTVALKRKNEEKVYLLSMQEF